MRRVEEMSPTDQPIAVQLPHNWRRSPPASVFFPRWVWHSRPNVQISQISRSSLPLLNTLKLRVAQGDWTSWSGAPSEIDFYAIKLGLSAHIHRIWHASLFAKPRCRWQPLGANSKLEQHGLKLFIFIFPTKRDCRVIGHSFRTASTISGWLWLPHSR